MTSPRPTFAQCFTAEEPLLVAVAAHAELVRVLSGLGYPDIKIRRDGWEAIRFGPLTVLYTGVGKANAAGALARELCFHPRYKGVVSLGIAGSYADHLPIASTVVSSRAVLADEGTQNGESFKSFVSRSLPAFALLEHDASGTVNTVSCISGTAALAAEYLRRVPEALIEDMELAALAGVCAQFGLPLCGLKIVSSYCGRPKTGDAATGLARIEQIVRGWCFPVRAGEPARNQGSS
ncbi:MAG: hypothetical protein U0105_27885 [Candidatus Obscuribacterales bacterium]